MQAVSSSVSGLQLGWQQMPCRQPHATAELGWGQHGSSATGRWVLGLDKATTNNSRPVYCLKSSQTRLPGLSPHPAVVHSGKLAGLGFPMTAAVLRGVKAGTRQKMLHIMGTGSSPLQSSTEWLLTFVLG